MNPTITRKLNEIKNRYKDQVTKKPAFKNDNDIKDFAIELLYDQLKKERLIRCLVGLLRNRTSIRPTQKGKIDKMSSRITCCSWLVPFFISIFPKENFYTTNSKRKD